MERIFLIIAVMDGLELDASMRSSLLKKLKKMDEGSVPHWHGLKSMKSADDEDDEEEEPHGKKTHVLFSSEAQGAAASRNDATEFIALLEKKHEEAGLKSPEEELIVVFLKSGAELNDKNWLKPITSALIVPTPLLHKNYFTNKEIPVASKMANAVSFGVESDDGAFTQTKAVGFDAAFRPQWTDSKASDMAASNGNSFASPALAGVATAMRLATYQDLPAKDLSLTQDYAADLDLSLNLWLCGDGIDIIDGVTAKNAHVFYKHEGIKPEIAARFAATWMEATQANQVAQAVGATGLEWDNMVSKAKENIDEGLHKKCRDFRWYVENVNTAFTEEEEEKEASDDKSASKAAEMEKLDELPDKPLEIPKVEEEEVVTIPERKEDEQFMEKKLDPPLSADRLAVIQKAKPVDITYVNITNRSEHPHLGAKDADGKWGYIHDPTSLRKNPPQFNFPDLNSACALRDNDFKMMSEQVSVDWKAHEAKESSGERRDKIFCLVYTIAESHDRIQYIRETWGPKCDGFMVGSTKTDTSIGTVEIPHEGPEEYNNIWQKVRSMWSYIYDNYYQDYDWFHIGGDDLFLIIENLRLYLESDEIRAAQNGGIHIPKSLESMTHQTPLFLGRRFAYQGDVNNLFLSGGSGYTLNKAALKTLVVEGIPKYFPHQVTFSEDTRLAEIFKKFDILPYNTKDEEGSERYNPFTPGHHWGYRPPPDMSKDWYAKYTIPLGNVHWGKEHCSKHSVAFHYVKNQAQKRLYALAYNKCPK